jgi:glycosyltransferase involved in cell wall biosynthesis
VSENFFVSVVIPVYNGEAFIRGAIETVRAQNYEPLEIIIVDDGSTDKTGSIVNSVAEHVRYVYQEHRGASSARNRGVALARGNLLAFLDADDLWPPDKLAGQIACFTAQPTLEIVSGYVQFMKCVLGANQEAAFEATGSPHFVMNLGGAIIKRSVFDRVGYFDEKLFLAEDANWLLRAFEKRVSIGVLKKVTLYYRRHPGGVSFGRGLRECGFIGEIKKSLDRRRCHGASVSLLPGLQYCEPDGG